MLKKIFNGLVLLFSSIGILFVGYIIFRIMDPTSASSDAKNNPGLVLIDYDKIDTLVYKKGNSNFCNSIGDSVVCKSVESGSVVFKNWEVPESPQADGDGAKTYLVGDFKLNEDYVILYADLWHDVTQILLWNRKINQVIVIGVNEGILYYSTKKSAFFVEGNDEPLSIQTWLNPKEDSTIRSYLCTARKGELFVDTAVGVKVEGKRKMLDLNRLQISRFLDCREDSSNVYREVPDFLRPYENR